MQGLLGPPLQFTMLSLALYKIAYHPNSLDSFSDEYASTAAASLEPVMHPGTATIYPLPQEILLLHQIKLMHTRPYALETCLLLERKKMNCALKK